MEIVNAHQALGLVVGVTGDGVNDAPAMNQADIGIAMGSGSEVSKETANLVLADDNFANVVVGISLGRLAFENLKKVLLYLLPAGTFCEALTVVFNVFAGVPPALSGFLMVVISCGTDMVSSLSLVFEKPEKSIMQKPPRDLKKDRLVNFKFMIMAYGFIGIIELISAYLVFFLFMNWAGYPMSQLIGKFKTPSDVNDLNIPWNDKTHPSNGVLQRGQAIFFFTLTIMQMFSLFSVRTRTVPQTYGKSNPAWGKSKNPRLFGSIFVALCLILIFTMIPFIQEAFGTGTFSSKIMMLK